LCSMSIDAIPPRTPPRSTSFDALPPRTPSPAAPLPLSQRPLSPFMQQQMSSIRIKNRSRLPLITTDLLTITPADVTKTLPPIARPLTPFMQQTLGSICVKDTTLMEAIAASKAAEAAAKATRRAKFAPGPKLLKLSGITCEGLPDADKEMGAGTSDPYVKFKLSTGAGDSEARTQTLVNAPRTVTFPDVLEMPLPDSFINGKCKGILGVQVWDDDSFEDGQEGVNQDDLMGYNYYEFNCRLRPYSLEGHVDRATFIGIGNLYAFRVSFRYEAVPDPDRSH